MSYEIKRNKIIREYIDVSTRHVNWIKLDGNAGLEHDKKVCEICLQLRQKKIEFMTRPLIWHTGIPHPIGHIADILFFQREPFIPTVIEVINSEKRNHAESKNYPEKFKLITINVDEEFELNE